MTPTVATKVTKHTDNLICHSVVLDKTELLQALDFGDELKTLLYKPSFRCIFTTSDLRDDS